MRKEYVEELESLKTKMEKAEVFAERLPLFADTIIGYKLTGEEDWKKFGDRYKKIPLDWGINRGFYLSGSNRYVMNYPKNKEYGLHLFNIYINTVRLFDSHENFGLYEYLKGVDMFFADTMNSTFYLTDEQISTFLEVLNTWYCDAIEKLKVHRLKEKEAKLRKELEETEARLRLGAA